uniref:ATP-dependent rRNA helicase SPB4-like C-terminal extension domain-containing protein n=1 Tax=Physcomitrium patens TaxID=3218 RepID=A0A2K1L1X5_PHYPA|nr:hypothetical protein PHYPA_002823 [Physcomitrium patens]
MVLDEDWVCRSTFLEWVERQVSDTGGAGVPEGSEGGERLFEMGAKVPLNEYEFPLNKIANVQSQLEKLVEKNYYLHQSARDAYRSYLLDYNSHAMKDIFNVHRLDLQVRNMGMRSGVRCPVGSDSVQDARQCNEGCRGAAV